MNSLLESVLLTLTNILTVIRVRISKYINDFMQDINILIQVQPVSVV